MKFSLPDNRNITPEEKLRDEGYKLIAGIDEAGRGALAGPVVASCVVLGGDFSPEGITDSKLLTPERREILVEKILSQAEAVGIGVVSHSDIDRLNILEASLLAMKLALDDCRLSPDVVLVDGNRGFAADVIVIPIIKGDLYSPSIGAASIVAKVTRDRLMEELSLEFTGYGFEKHKGYGTSEHLLAIRELGPSPIHRYSFSPIAQSSQRELFVDD